MIFKAHTTKYVTLKAIGNKMMKYTCGGNH